MNYYEISKRISNDFSCKQCLHPDASQLTCSKQIVRAHTVRKSADLKKLSEAGHVYHMSFDAKIMDKPPEEFKPTKIGINRASTFYGFCSTHDTEIFAPIETQAFKGTPEQCFLLGYRAFSKEVHSKEGAIRSVDTIREYAGKSQSMGRHEVEQAISAFELGTKSSQYDLKVHYEIYQHALIEKEWDEFRAVIIYFDSLPDILCSGISKPEYDFLGNQLQDLGQINIVHKMITLNILTLNDVSVAVFQWQKNSDSINLPFINSLLSLPTEDIPHAVARAAFESTENLYFRPSWWEKLAENDKRNLLVRAVSGTPLKPRGSSDLKDDSTRFVNWKVGEIIRVNMSA